MVYDHRFDIENHIQYSAIDNNINLHTQAIKKLIRQAVAKAAAVAAAAANAAVVCCRGITDAGVVIAFNRLARYFRLFRTKPPASHP